MPRAYLMLGQCAGVCVHLHVSWLLFLPLAAAAFALEPLSAADADWSPLTRVLLGLATAGLMALSVAAHVAGHLAMALLHQIPVRHLSLNPYGGNLQVASTPVSARSIAWTALAGPLVSFALGGFWLSVWWFLEFVVFYWLAQFNLFLGLFHLMPTSRVDGGRLLWLFSKRYAALFERREVTTVVTLVAAHTLILPGSVLLLSGLLYGNPSHIFGGVLIAIAGLLFLEIPAQRASVRSPAEREWLQGTTVTDLVGDEPPIRRPVRAGSGAALTPKSVFLSADTYLPPDARSRRPLPALTPWVVGPNASLLDALRQMDDVGGSRLLVVAGSRIVRTLTREQIYERLESQKQRDGASGGETLVFEETVSMRGANPWN